MTGDRGGKPNKRLIDKKHPYLDKKLKGKSGKY